MKTLHSPSQFSKGFTLLEMTIVIMILLTLVNIGLFTSSKMDEWKLGRAASETLRMVYSAQRMYLADNPTTEVKDLTDEMLIPYLPNLGAEAAKKSTLVDALKTDTTVKPITGGGLTFSTTSPPHFMQGGQRYDPSDSNTDSLWDVGE